MAGVSHARQAGEVQESTRAIRKSMEDDGA